MKEITNPHSKDSSIAILEVPYGKYHGKEIKETSLITAFYVGPGRSRNLVGCPKVLYLKHNLNTSQAMDIINMTNNISPKEAKSQEFQNKLEEITNQ